MMKPPMKIAAVAEADQVGLAGRGGKRGHLLDEVVGGTNVRRAVPPLAAQKLGGCRRTKGPAVADKGGVGPPFYGDDQRFNLLFLGRRKISRPQSSRTNR